MMGFGKFCFTTIAAICLLAFGSGTAAATELSDIERTWAKDSILELVDAGVIDGYPDGTFRPGEKVTRAEFAKMAVIAFELPRADGADFADVRDHWGEPYIGALAQADILQGYPDGSFRPDRPINRAEMAAMLVRIVGIDDMAQAEAAHWRPSFGDVAGDHWAFGSVEAAGRLGLFPPFFSRSFEPDQETTRAETAYMISSGRDLRLLEGTAVNIGERPGDLTVRALSGTETRVRPGSDVVVYRNGEPSDLQSIRRGDQVNILADRYGRAHFAAVSGGEARNDDVAARARELVQEMLTPEQVAAIINGDWDSAGNALKTSLYHQLIDEGAQPHEAAAILDRDWNSLQELGKARLAEETAHRLQVSPDLAFAVMNQDWTRAQEYAQVEALEYILSEVLFKDQPLPTQEDLPRGSGAPR